MKWDAPQERALALVFEGRWTQEEITDRLIKEFGESSPKFTLSVRALKAWIANQDFQAKLADMRANFAVSIQGVTYADKARRIIALNQMAESARREYEERVRLIETRPSPFGDARIERFNKDAHEAFRAALDDIAKELGERSTSVKVSGTMQHSLVPSGELKELADEMLDAVRTIPEAREALGLRLLASGE